MVAMLYWEYNDSQTPRPGRNLFLPGRGVFLIFTVFLNRCLTISEREKTATIVKVCML